MGPRTKHAGRADEVERQKVAEGTPAEADVEHVGAADRALSDVEHDEADERDVERPGTTDEA